MAQAYSSSLFAINTSSSVGLETNAELTIYRFLLLFVLFCFETGSRDVIQAELTRTTACMKGLINFLSTGVLSKIFL